MCAIIDANARDDVFGKTKSEGGKQFFDWLMKPNGGTFVAGGKLLRELEKDSPDFVRIFAERKAAGRAFQISDEKVDAVEESIKEQRLFRSNDPHVLALAQVSGARLLFTYETTGQLQRDFKNPRILANPRGKVYPHANYQRFLNDRRNRNLCSYQRDPV